jgi:hypothetical protein
MPDTDVAEDSTDARVLARDGDKSFWQPIGKDEPAMSQDADAKAAAKIARGNLGGRDPITVPTIKGDDDYQALMPGMKFKDPSGNVRTKPYKVESDEQYEEIPEGVQFLDPEGKLRTKPKYEGIDFTAQTLYDMAVNDKERRKALERSYPGKVKERAGKLYIDDNGTLRRPKGFGDAPVAGLTAAAAPTIGAVGGEILGGTAGTVAEPGGGTILGAIGGGAAGGAAGQGFNDIIMGLAGVYDRSAGEEAAEVGLSAAAGGVGTALGRGVAAVAPAVKGALTQAAPKAAASFLGADEGSLETALKLRDQGVMVAPSTWAKESPHLANVAEVFDPAFRMQKPLLQSATGHYEQSAGKILEDIGVKPEGKISDPTTAPSTQKAGEAVLAKRLEAQTIADKKLSDAIAEAQLNAATGSVRQATAQGSLEKTAAESRRAAQSLIDAGFKDIQADVDTAMRTAKAGHNSGDLWQAVGDKLVKIRQGIAERAKVWYGQADQAAGNHMPNTGELPRTAAQFLEQLPEPFKSKYPDAVKKLEDLAGKVDEDGNVIKEPVQPTFGQLHELRTWFRSNVDYHDLTPGIREGVYKFFAKQVDDALHDVDAVPELKLAAQLLDATDKWYGEQIRPLQDARIQAVVKGLESGLPADPKVLFDTLVKEGRTDLTRKVAGLIGPNLWAGVKAADVQQMLEASKSLVPDVIDGNAFTREVLSRSRSGMLEAVHGKEASAKLLQQAQNVAALNGKLDIPVRPGDKMADIIGRAREAAAAAKAAADKDPLATLGKETKKIIANHQRELANTRNTDPLGFIYKPTVGAAQAVDKILESEDLILAAGGRFGENSPEFNQLRQVWAQKLLMGTLEPSTRLAKYSPEVQNIMFPGTSLGQMQQLAKEMDFLLSSKAVTPGSGSGAGPSMSAFAKVEHPWASLPLGKAAGKIIPGFDAAGRAMLGKYYAFVTKMTNSPTLMRFVLRGLKGDEQGRQMARQAVQSAMRAGGAVGAGVGEAEFQAPNQ